MSSKKVHFLLGLAAVALFLTTLSGISNFVLSALYTIIAVLVAIAAITATKATTIATKTAITGKLNTEEGNKKITVPGRIAASGVAFVGIATAALAVFIATNMGTVGIFAVPMLTALYLYNYKGEIVEKEITSEDRNDENTVRLGDRPSVQMEIKEVCYQLVSSTLTDVNDNLLYGLGNGIGNYTHSLYNKIQSVTQVQSRGQA